ncbi:MAG: hypothetical protein ACPGN3_15845, partial [Opitutales bacterium]
GSPGRFALPLLYLESVGLPEETNTLLSNRLKGTTKHPETTTYVYVKSWILIAMHGHKRRHLWKVFANRLPSTSIKR